MDTETKKIYLIRHAQTEYNVLNKQALEQNLSKGHFKHVPELVDCDCSPYGYEQAKEASKKVNNLDIELVLVSPMRRALRTATLMFENHPNKPKLLALPIIREILSSSCDIPREFSRVKEEFPQVDFSLIESLPHPRLWVLGTLQDEKTKKEITEAVSQNPESVDYVDLMLKRFKTEKTANETRKGNKERAGVIRKVLGEFLEKHSKVAVVTHYSTLKVLTANTFNERDRAVDGVKFENAQVYEWNLDF